MELKVSIALCTYNGEKHIGEQIQSLLSQTHLPDEIVICDDNSTDNTLDIISKLPLSSVPIRVYRNPVNLGFIRNFAQALKACSGDVIFPSDQDDIWISDKIEVMLAEFVRNPDVGMVFCDAYVVDENLKRWGTQWNMLDFSRKERAAFIAGNGIDVLAKRNVITGMLIAVRRSALRDTFPFTHLCFHDEWIGLVIACQYKIVLLNRPLVFYRQHSHQRIGVKRRTIYRKLRSRIKNNGITRCRRRIERLSILVERLERSGIYDPELLERLRNRIHHWRIRASLPKNKLERLWAIIKELDRYKLYENRLIAIKDWIEC